MKKRWGILFAVLCVMSLAGCAGHFAPADVEEIVLLSHYEDIQIRLQPGDADFERILRICRGDMYDEISGCPFGVSEIQFIAGEETVSIFPTGDGCRSFAVGDIGGENKKLVSLSDKDMQELKSILQSYGIPAEGVN